MTAPRLAWPLRLAGSSLATVEQDGDDDIEQCFRAIVRARPGDRPDIPAMGTEDPTHGEQPLDLDALSEILRRHEPRGEVLLEQRPDLVDRLVADVGAAWSRAETNTTDEDETDA